MRILIFGAGVIGSLYAARLHAAGHDVVVLARGKRLEAIRQSGLLLEDVASQVRTTIKVSAIGELTSDDPYDLVVVPVRFDQLTSALEVLAASQRTPQVLFFGNNLLGADRLARAIGRERVLLGFPGAGGQHQGDLIRYLLIPQQKTTLGELDGSRTERLQRLAGVFRAAGFSLAVSRDMESWLKTHAAFVSSVAAAVYAANGDASQLAARPDLLRLMVRAIRESFHALAAVGVRAAPLNLRLLVALPEWFAAAYWQRQFASALGQFSLAAHANSARDEMTALANEVRHILASTQAPKTPALDQLLLRAGL